MTDVGDVMIPEVTGVGGIKPRSLRIPPIKPAPGAELVITGRVEATSVVEGTADGVRPTAPRSPPKAPSNPPPRERVLVDRINPLELGTRRKEVEGNILPNERHEEPWHKPSRNPRLISTLMGGIELVIEQVGQRPSRIPKFKLASTSGCIDFLDVIKVVGGRFSVAVGV